MSRFSFIILHYNTIEDTKACVSSIEKMCINNEYRIYIVDNASPNNSGKDLNIMYSKKEYIRVIQSNENLGFARGNNIGIEQAIKDCFNDFVVVLNSDTKVIQSDFCERIKNEYAKSQFAALGPTIYTPSGKSTINPGRAYVLQGAELNAFQHRCRRKLFLFKTHLYLLTGIFKKRAEISLKAKERDYKYTENCLLHGCCLIFSKKYLDVMHGFDPRTFLYYEEEILFLHCKMLGLKTIYNPDIKIWHKEDGATDSVLSSSRKKEMFICKNVLESIKVYKKILEEYSSKKELPLC